MRKRLVILMGLLALLINACSLNNSSPSSSDSTLAPLSAEDAAAFGRSESPITIRIGLHIPARDINPVNPYIEKLTNIRIMHPWEAEGEDAYKQKVDLAIASRDLPDAMVVDRTQLRKLMEGDMIQDLTQVFETYGSRLVKDIYDSTSGEALKDATYDGMLYGLPNVAIDTDSPTLLWLRQDWLDKLKLSPPKTLEDVEKISQAFINEDPDGDGKANTGGLPPYRLIVFGQKPGLGGFDSVFHSYGAFPRSWIRDADGKIVYGSITGQNKQALAKLADWYKGGVIDPQFALNKLIQEPIVNNKTGMFFGPWWVPYWPLAGSVALDTQAEWRAYPVPLREDGAFSVHMAPVTDRYLVVRRGYAHPEAAVKILNVLTRLERKQDPNLEEAKKLDDAAIRSGTLLRNFYPFDLLLDYSDSVVKRYESIQAVQDNKKPVQELDAETRTLYDKIMKEREEPKQDMDAWMTALAYESGVSALVSTPLVKSRGVFYGTTPTMETEWSFLERLETAIFQKIIMGELPIEAFDSFVQYWLEAGGATITEEVNNTVSPK